jgi:glycolate oxidase
LGLQVVLADGTLLNLGRRTKKGVTGYDLCSLITGSEGTLAIVTEATLRLLPKPEYVATLMVLLSSLDEVSKTLRAIAQARVQLRCAELLDEIALGVLRKHSGVALPKEANALMILEIDGEEASAKIKAERVGNLLLELGVLDVLVAADSSQRERLWAARHELSRTLRREAKFKISEDVVVPQSQLSALLKTCAQISKTSGITMPTYGHAGDGNMHVNFLWNDPSEKEKVERAAEQLFVETLRLGGSLSGEHGIGLAKKRYLHLEQAAPLIELQKKIKAAWDPKNLLNPGKIFPTSHGAC